MRILKKDMKVGMMTFGIDNYDDLWTLYHIINRGDVASMWTLRTLQRKTDKIRPEKTEKKRMYLSIEVENVEYHEFADMLRVHGKIVQGPQDIGSYHTFNIKPGDVITIQKEKWHEIELRVIKRAIAEGKRPTVLVISVEDDNILIASVHSYGIKEHAWLYLRGGRKSQLQNTDGSRAMLYAEAFAKLKAINPDGDLPVLIIGPGFIKNDFVNYIKNHYPTEYQQIFKKMALDSTGQGGMRGIYEALKRGSFGRIIKELAIERENEIVEEIMGMIGRGDWRIEYGPKNVLSALETGAVERLYITSEFIKSISRDKEKFSLLDDLCNKYSVDIKIISSSHEGGTRIDNFGGIIAILRYRYK